MAIVIKSDRKWKQFKYRNEVPAKVLADQFDWTNDAHAEHGDYEDGFLCYRGHWYHLGDFERIHKMSPSDPHGGMAGVEFQRWTGISHDSLFSGVVIKVSTNGDEYQIGTYIATGD